MASYRRALAATAHLSGQTGATTQQLQATFELITLNCTHTAVSGCPSTSTPSFSPASAEKSSQHQAVGRVLDPHPVDELHDHSVGQKRTVAQKWLRMSEHRTASISGALQV